jgi:hypothetical protein
MRDLLRIDGHTYAKGHQYGNGPNWRMRVIREALQRIGMNPDLLRHGISREIYGMPLTENWREFLQGKTTECSSDRPSVEQIAAACLSRWVIPRAQRRPEFRHWTREQTAGLFQDPSCILETPAYAGVPIMLQSSIGAFPGHPQNISEARVSVTLNWFPSFCRPAHNMQTRPCAWMEPGWNLGGTGHWIVIPLSSSPLVCEMGHRVANPFGRICAWVRSSCRSYQPPNGPSNCCQTSASVVQRLVSVSTACQ